MSIRHAILGLLARDPASGYDLLRTFQLSLAHVWPATQSQLYAELGRMTEAGFMVVHAEGGRGRKEYAITGAGRAELRRWLLEVEPDPPRRNDAVLRVFFLDQVAPEEAREYLERQAASAAARHEELTALRSVAKNDSKGLLIAYGLLSLEYGLRLAEMNREWARWAAGQITASGLDIGHESDQSAHSGT